MAYVNDQVALSARGYDYQSGGWGLFVSEGTATFSSAREAEILAQAMIFKTFIAVRYPAGQKAVYELVGFEENSENKAIRQRPPRARPGGDRLLLDLEDRLGASAVGKI